MYDINTSNKNFPFLIYLLYNVKQKMGLYYQNAIPTYQPQSKYWNDN